MGQKRAQKQREQASPLVESGETVRHALTVTSGPLWALSLGPIGAAILKYRNVVLTDKALYVMTATAMSGGPKAVEQRMPLGSVALSTGKHSMPMQSTLVVGDQRWNVAKPFKEEAEQLVAAAAAG